MPFQLDPPGLCNGTRLVVSKLMNNVVQAEIITGIRTGQTVLIPRIPLFPNESAIPFKRLQFPLRLCYAFTVNKSQGQTLKTAGLYLEEPVFAHGQLYVGCSRVGRSGGLYIYAPNNRTKNVVLKPALQ